MKFFHKVKYGSFEVDYSDSLTGLDLLLEIFPRDLMKYIFASLWGIYQEMLSLKIYET